MTTQSFTGEIQADNWSLVSTLTGVTLTSGNKFNITVVKQCQFKVADYIVPVFNQTFDYIATSDDLYIKTGAPSCTLSILDCGAAS